MLRRDALDEPLVAEEVAREVHVAVVDEHSQRVAGHDDLVEDRAGVVVQLHVLRVDVVAERCKMMDGGLKEGGGMVARCAQFSEA